MESKITAPPNPKSRRIADSTWKNLALFLFTLGAIVLCGLMLRPFLPAITGAIVLAIVTYTPYLWIEQRVARPTLAATISLLLVILCIIGPVAYILWSLGHHILSAAHLLQGRSPQQGVAQIVNQSPRIANALQYLSDKVDLSSVLNKGAGVVGAWLASVFGGSIAVVTQIVILLFLLFFLYRDHRRAAEGLRSLLPFEDADANYLLMRLVQTVRATVLGRFVVATLQGVIAGITYAALSVPAASLLGILTAFCAMIPSFGAVLIWAPVAIWLALAHHWIQAIILACIGVLIISTLDNFLYPVLIGSELQQHTVIIFVSILGGIWLFGISGLVLGPIIFSVTQSLLILWREKAAKGSGPGEKHALPPSSSDPARPGNVTSA